MLIVIYVDYQNFFVMLNVVKVAFLCYADCCHAECHILHFYAEYYYPVYNRGTIHTLWKLACNNSYNCKWFILFASCVNVIKLFSSSLKLRLKKLVCLPLAIILNNKKNFFVVRYHSG